MPTNNIKAVKLVFNIEGEIAGKLFDEAFECGETMQLRLEKILEWYFSEETP